MNDVPSFLFDVMSPHSPSYVTIFLQHLFFVLKSLTQFFKNDIVVYGQPPP